MLYVTDLLTITDNIQVDGLVTKETQHNDDVIVVMSSNDSSLLTPMNTSAVQTDDKNITNSNMTSSAGIHNNVTSDAPPQRDFTWDGPYNVSIPLPVGRYSVISCSTPMRDQFNYAFILPLTVKAWTRIQYHTLVLLVGSQEYWLSSFPLRVVLSELSVTGARVVFIETSYEHTVMVSQTVRLFASDLFSWEDPLRSSIVTSDADLWPMMAGAYDLAEGKNILSLNSECCRKLNRHNLTFKMLPIGNIAMTVQQWRNIMHIDQSERSNAMNIQSQHRIDAISILKYFHAEFGDAVYRPTQKGENEGWYMDQIMISLRIEQWLNQFDVNRTMIQYVGRNTRRDRIDRRSWRSSLTLHRVVDCHVLKDAYHRGTWERLYALLRLMYAQSQLDLLSNYRHNFIMTLSKSVQMPIPPIHKTVP